MRADKPIEFRGPVRPAFAATRQRGRVWRWVHRKTAFCLPVGRLTWDRRTPEDRRRGDELVAQQFSWRSTARMLSKFGARGHFDDRGRVREDQFLPAAEVPTNVVPFGSRVAR
jgi:hypothetical protein